MAIIHCPGCSRRISNKFNVCPHCELPLGEMTAEELDRVAHRRWRKRLYQAANLTYVAMTLLIVGAVWWWLAAPEGWVLPPPVGAIALVMIGVAAYLAGRVWLFWLRMRRNRPGS